MDKELILNRKIKKLEKIEEKVDDLIDRVNKIERLYNILGERLTLSKLKEGIEILDSINKK